MTKNSRNGKNNTSPLGFDRGDYTVLASFNGAELRRLNAPLDWFEVWRGGKSVGCTSVFKWSFGRFMEQARFIEVYHLTI